MHVSYKGTTYDTAEALNNLRAELSRLLSAPSLKGVTVSSKVVLFEPNNELHPVYAVNPTLSVLPASIEKMFTSSSTIWALGTKYAFTTKLDMPQTTQVKGSQIVGDVYLRPSGDPTFRSSDFDEIAKQLRAKGITAIHGDIISDLGGEDILSPEAKKYFSKLKATTPKYAGTANTSLETKDSLVDDNNAVSVSEDGMASSSEDTSEAVDEQETDSDEEVSPVGVLSSYPNFAIDRNVVQVTVSGGGAKGSPLRVSVFPPIGAVVVQNQGSTSAPAVVRTKKVGKGKKARTVRYRTQGTTTIRVSSLGGPHDQVQAIRITGQLPANVRRTYSFPIKNVPLAMAGLLKWRLQQNGITVTGAPKAAVMNTGGTPIQTVASIETNLMDLLKQMNKRSDNYLAESMFRKLSTIATVAATTPDERARKLMKSWLEVCNVDGSQCVFIDGSGLSKSNRTTANSVIDLLAAIRKQGLFEHFTPTLSVAGFDGTLRNRMKGTLAQYNAHGKTGTLNGVTALAGYVTTKDGQLAAYFITMQKFRNGPWTHKKTQDAIVSTLANFSYGEFQNQNNMVTGTEQQNGTGLQSNTKE